MDRFLRRWQARHLPRRKPLPVPGPEADVVELQAGPLTVVAAPAALQRLGAAAGLYSGPAHRPGMSRDDDDHIMTGVYVGIGLLLVAGAGYLAWRYALSDEQKRKAVNATKDLVADGITKGKRAVRDARGKVGF